MPFSRFCGTLAPRSAGCQATALTNGTRTSQGPGPGPKTLPAAEANALLAAKYAIRGDQPPDDIGAEPTTRPFPHVPGRKAATSN